MVSVYRFSEPEIITFALMLIRLSAFVVSWPVFGVELVPAPVKILLALIMALAVFPTINWHGIEVGFDSSSLIWMAIREAFIGVALGYLARMFLMAIQIAGDLISLSIGLSGAQIFNPAFGGQSSPIDQMFYALAALVYLAINGHHLFISAIIDTFRIIPISPNTLSAQGLIGIGAMVQEIVSIGIRISAPVVISILMVNLVMGVLGKAVPQINVLVTSLAVNALVGFVILIIALPIMVDQVPDVLEISSAQIFKMLRSF